MKSDIRVCSAWEEAHDRPVYTLGGTCPECGARAVNSAPAPFAPGDPHGEYRRRRRRRVRDGERSADRSEDPGDDGDPEGSGDAETTGDPGGPDR